MDLLLMMLCAGYLIRHYFTGFFSHFFLQFCCKSVINERSMLQVYDKNYSKNGQTFQSLVQLINPNKREIKLNKTKTKLSKL